MAIDQSLNLKLDQKLVMTPQLQLAIKILQMPTQDLQGFIGQELMDNPFLTSDDGTSEQISDPQDSAAEEMDSVKALESENIGSDVESLDMGWDSMYDSGTSHTSGGGFDDGDESYLERTASTETTLKQHLQQQVGEVTDDPKLHFLCSYLIDSIDDAGYMRGDTNNIAERLNVEKALVEDALELLQTLDPAGVAARDLLVFVLLFSGVDKEVLPQLGGHLDGRRVRSPHGPRLRRGHPPLPRVLRHPGHGRRLDPHVAEDDLHLHAFVFPSG